LKPHGDILHTNTIELVETIPSDSLHPLKKGSLLISIRELSLVCAVDLEEKTVYWGESDLWYRQHQPALLENGNILVFDNEGLKGKSSIIEYNPVTGNIVWVYRGNEDRPFFSSVIGSSQRLPNRNTLITESKTGRAFEVTPEKKIVWEYVNPHRAGRDPKLIALLLEVVRLNKQFPIEWLATSN
jgi:hypothetical protein